MLESLRECGSVSVQCESVLCVESDEAARLGALECVRSLSWARLSSVSASEASLFDVLRDHLCGRQSELGCEERLSCWLSLSVLGCRNGVAVVVRAEVVEQCMAALPGAVAPLATAVSSDEIEAELRACSAANLCAMGLVTCEVISKAAPEARAAAEACWLRVFLGSLGSFA